MNIHYHLRVYAIIGDSTFQLRRYDLGSQVSDHRTSIAHTQSGSAPAIATPVAVQVPDDTAAPAVVLLPVESVHVGPETVEQSPPPTHALSALLLPIAVNREGTLLAGAARLEFARDVGWTHIDARVWESADDPGLQLQLEWERNLGRTDVPLLTQARYVREVLRPVFEARVAMVQRGNAARLNQMVKGEGANFVPSLPTPVGKWRDYISARVSIGGETMLKFLKMQDWAVSSQLSETDRACIRSEVAIANETGKVDAPFRRAKAVHLGAAAAPGKRETARHDVSRVVLQITKTELALANLDPMAFASAVVRDQDALEDFQAAVQSAYRALDQVDQLAEAVAVKSSLRLSA